MRVDIEKLVPTGLQPGDVCVMRVAHDCTADDMQFIRERWDHCVGDGVKLIILGPGMTLEAYRPVVPE